MATNNEIADRWAEISLGGYVSITVSPRKDKMIHHVSNRREAIPSPTVIFSGAVLSKNNFALVMQQGPKRSNVTIKIEDVVRIGFAQDGHLAVRPSTSAQMHTEK